jgi:phosphoglycerate kinase
MKFKKLENIELRGKRVLIRQDLNVPIRDGNITSAARIDASLPTVIHAIKSGAKVMLMSHLGRPAEGGFDEQYSLRPVAQYLSKKLGQNIELNQSYLETLPELEEGEVVLLENVRFNIGEAKNDENLSRKYANLCDIYVMDAFGTAHRAQSSTYGVGKFADVACAGPLLSAELFALDAALKNPKPPVVAIVGGAKVSTKLTVLESLSDIVDQLIPGGGIANTFIAAAGFNVGKSLYEPSLVDEAQNLMQLVRNRGGEIPVPTDVVVGTSFSSDAVAVVKLVDAVSEEDLILDIGPDTTARYSGMMKEAGTIIWNGPVGVFEFPQFSGGTEGLGLAIKNSDAFSIAGGGDTLAAIDRFQLSDDISYISTGGGAFLEFLEGKLLPAVEMLQNRDND